MSETGTWSPRCPKCGRLTSRTVTPQPNHIFAGRLSPRALEGATGQRERCPRCATWFVLSVGTEWVLRDTPVPTKKPEGEAAVPETFED